MADQRITEADIVPAAQASQGQTIRESDIVPDKTLWDQAKDGLSHLVGGVTGTIGAVMHPIKTVAAALKDAGEELDQAHEAQKAGKTEEAFDHYKNAIPFVGPLIRQLNDEWNKGEYGAMAGDAGAAYLMGKAGDFAEAIPSVAGKMSDFASTVKDAVTGQSGLAKDVVGLASPRAAHAMGVAGKLGRIYDALTGNVKGGPSSGPQGAVGAPAPLPRDLMRIPADIDTSSPVNTRAVPTAPAPAGPPMAGPMAMPSPQASNFSWPGEMNGAQTPAGEVAMPQRSPAPAHGEAPQDFAGPARTKKARALASFLNNPMGPGGETLDPIAHDDFVKLPAKQQQQYLGDIAKALGLNKTGQMSAESVAETLFEWKKLERAPVGQ